MKYIAVLFFFFTFNLVWSQAISKVEGYAPEYVGKSIEIFAYEDYLSMVKSKLASSEVKQDSTFKLTFYNDQTRKLRVEIGENHFFIYAQPKGAYNLFIKGSSPYIRGEGSNIEAEFFFLDLDSTDINFKILMYEDKQLTFLKENYNRETKTTTEFSEALDAYKLKIGEELKEDTNGYFKNYVRYSLASLDNMFFNGSRNRYEKYDFYIKPQTVFYQNDRYMEYILNYYDQYSYQLSKELNESFYNGVLQSSPSRVINALGKDYALKNVRLRELVMIKMLSDVFYSQDYPQTNILSMLDSLSEHALFDKHKSIASNVYYRLTDLTPGSVMPNFLFTLNGEKKSKKDFEGNHLYIQFLEAGSISSAADIPILKPLFEKYGKYTEFITVLVTKEDDPLLENSEPYIQKHNISWDVTVLSEDDPILKRLNVVSFPHYIFMDATGYVVQAPALSPRPNNEYETIERLLFEVHRRRKAMDEMGE
jgi:hypothetical protein